MKVSNVMTKKVDMIGPDTTLAEVARRMRDDDVGSLPIADEDRLVGMITDRDIVIRALAAGKSPDQATVREAMSDRVLYCFEDQELDEIAHNMANNQVRRLPVLNRDKRLVGIISLGDLGAAGARGAAGEALGRIAAH